jgi:hypothetical protein
MYKQVLSLKKNITMKKVTIFSALALMAATVFVSCKKDDAPQQPAVNATVFAASGDINAKLTDYRNLLGSTLNTAPGATGGRREINWDAVPPSFTNVGNFPLDFFGSADPALANGRKRGFVLLGGSTFRVDSTDFADIDPSFAGMFDAFSPKKLFAYMGNTVTQAVFKVPGTNTEASVKGFGVIFSGVDNDKSTYIEYFNGDKSLGVYYAPVRAAGSSFSFLGVHFPDEKVTKVKITVGSATLNSGTKDVTAGGSADLVVMDDFLYSEPVSLQ